MEMEMEMEMEMGMGFLKATDVTRCSTTKLQAEQAVSCTATWNLTVLKFFSSNNFFRQGLCNLHRLQW
ncbi:hypothetical protein Peur_054799 [Populus x canadensis]